jgi:transcriptional regulator with XRE-family HTH domain
VNRLKWERLERRLSQEALGVLANMRQKAVSEVESGYRRASRRELNALAAALNIHPPEALLQNVVRAEVGS